MAKVKFTAGRVAGFTCPIGKSQAFLWDAVAPGLALRVTAGGARAYVYQGRLNDKTIRYTIGEPRRDDGGGTWSIPDAQAEARRLQGLVDQGKDPRVEKAATSTKDVAARDAAKAARRRLDLGGLEAWAVYCKERRSKWGDHNRADHLNFASPGGKPRKGSDLLTAPGPLHALLSRPLAMIDAKSVDAWVTRETSVRPTRAALGFRLLRAFVNWCAEHPTYRDIVQADACASKRTREKVAKPNAKDDSLQHEQLTVWFREVRKTSNPVQAAYLQALLLTGARREELMALQWRDVDFQWKSMRIRDKVEGERVIPLTPFVAQLLNFLPRYPGNTWVFSSTAAKSGRLQEPRLAHNRALQRAGLPNITLHGLRRSFGSLAEWVECPVGVVAQIQGHKPSAIAEKHYRVRPLDLLRMWHVRIEEWILARAGMSMPADQEQRVGLHAITAP